MKKDKLINTISKKNRTLAKSLAKTLTTEQVHLVSGAGSCKHCGTKIWVTGSDGITRQECDTFYC